MRLYPCSVNKAAGRKKQIPINLIWPLRRVPVELFAGEPQEVL